jgi:hypothetical protein
MLQEKAGDTENKPAEKHRLVDHVLIHRAFVGGIPHVHPHPHI